MIMKQIYEKLVLDGHFKKLISSNNHKLIYFFTMVDDGMALMHNINEKSFFQIIDVQEFQVGLSDKDKSKIIPIIFNVFEDEKRNIEIGSLDIQEPATSFKKENQELKEFDLNKLKIDLDEALKIAFKLRDEKYKSHYPLKIIILLQNLDIGQVWNITFLSMSFDTLNIKINCENGMVVEDSLNSIVSNFNNFKDLKNKITNQTNQINQTPKSSNQKPKSL